MTHISHTSCLSMISSENRFPLFGIMLWLGACSAAASVRQDLRHLLNLRLVVPFAVRREDVADEEISDVQAVDGARQRLDVDVLANDAGRLPLREPVDHRAPDMRPPNAHDRVAQLLVLRD